MQTNLTGRSAVCSRDGDAAAHDRRDKRAPRLSLLSTYLQLLLLAQAPFPRQTRAVGHALRVWVLSSPLSHQEQPDDAQELATPRYVRHAQAATQDIGHVRPAAHPLQPQHVLTLPLRVLVSHTWVSREVINYPECEIWVSVIIFNCLEFIFDKTQRVLMVFLNKCAIFWSECLHLPLLIRY